MSENGWFVAIAGFVVAGCSSSPSAPPANVPDAGAEEDANGDQRPDNPPSVTCNGKPCASPSFCCARPSGAGCVATGCAKDEEAPIRCDEDKNCGSGQTCCALVFNGHLNSVACSDACTGVGAYHRCGPTTACGSAACKALADAVGTSIVPDAKISVCAP